MALPLSERKFFGHALDFAQHGDRHDGAKVLKGFGGGHVPRGLHGEVRGSGVRPARFPEKEREGITTPKEDLDTIRARLRVAEPIAKEMRDGKTHR